MSLLIVVACYYHTSVTHTTGDNFLVCFTDFTNNDDSEELRGCTGCAGCARIDRIYFNIIRASHAAVRPCVRVFLMTICSQCRSLGCVPDSADEAFEANVCFFTMWHKCHVRFLLFCLHLVLFHVISCFLVGLFYVSLIWFCFRLLSSLRSLVLTTQLPPTTCVLSVGHFEFSFSPRKCSFLSHSSEM